MSYIYQSDIYCDDCGKDIRQRLREEAKKRNEKLEIETSDEYPQSCDGLSTESDQPEHCGSHDDCLNAWTLEDGTKVGMFLENDLTTDGYDYVRELWDEHVKNGGGNEEVLRMWMDFYGLSYDLDDEDESE